MKFTSQPVWFRVYQAGLIIISLLALLYPAILNGFPLVYSDTGTYIAAEKTHSIPVDRPIGYSLFLNITSLNVSLWFTIIIQSIIIFYLISQFFKAIYRLKYSLEWTAGVVIILSLATSVSNFNSQLMPDIFVSWMIFCLIIILFQKNKSISRNILISVIFIFSFISHLSILLGATIITVLVFLLNLKFRWVSIRNGYLALSLIVCGWLVVPIINFHYGAGFTITRSKNTSMMGRFIETGIAGDFLKENCSSGKYSLCKFKDKLPPLCYLFLWDESSPLYDGPCLATGWGNCWLDKDKEYGILIADIVSTPKYWKRIMSEITLGTYHQLLVYNIGVLVPMKEVSAPYGCIKTYYPQNLQAYVKADQYDHILYFGAANKILSISIIISIVLLPLMLTFFPELRKGKFIGFVGIILFAFLINAIICSAFSSVVDRYQSRVIWLLPFLVLTGFALVIENRIRKQTHLEEATKAADKIGFAVPLIFPAGK